MGASEVEPVALPRGARRRLRNRESMLNAAEELMATRSVSEVRVEDVAEAADVAVGSVYSHFGSKAGLVHAVAERCLAQATASFDVAYSSSDSALEQANATGTAFMRLLVDHPFLVRYLSSDTSFAEVDDDTESITRAIDALLQEFERRLDAAIAAGEARPADTRLLAHFLLGAWTGVAALMLRTDARALSAQEVEASLEQARRIITLGLRVPE